MRKLLILLYLVKLTPAWSQSSTSTHAFTIYGKAAGTGSKFVYAWYYDITGKFRKDSASIINGRFILKGNLAEPSVAYISFKAAPNWNTRSNDISPALFIEPAAMYVTIKSGDCKHLTLTGSNTQDEYVALEKSKHSIYAAMQPYNDKFDSLNKQYRLAKKAGAAEALLELLSAKMDTVRDALIPFNDSIKKIDLDFISHHPNSFISPYRLQYYVADFSYAALNNYYSGFSKKVQQSRSGIDIAQELQKLLNGSPGSKAFVFETIDVTGKPLSLNDYRGQYVLLDFWASWCVPCRAGNPHLKELYARYHNKGIEFIGISDNDPSPDKWKAAIEQDGIGMWKHVLRGLKMKKGTPVTTNDMHYKYGIHYLPTKILIDPTGIIIGRFVAEGEQEDALDKMLAEIFK